MAVCPEDFAMQTLCLDARKGMVQKGKMPPSAHEFALLDMAFSNSTQFAMSRHEPGIQQNVRTLLHRLGQPFEEMDDPEKMELNISPEVQQILEERRILISDIRKVIQHAESTGETLIHPETGHTMVAFKPYKVMFWVEYSRSGNGFILHNAYSHRMEVAGKGQS